MKCVDNTYLDKLEFLPDEVELAVPKSWCYSAISIMERMELCEELIYMINSCIYSGEHKHDSPGNVSKYVKMSVGNVKKIIRICGKETLCYILPYNYGLISNDFLCNKLGNLKFQIDALVNSEDYDTALNLIMDIKDISKKHLALVYMKSIYIIQTENKIVFFKNSRRALVHKINSIIKESQTYF